MVSVVSFHQQTRDFIEFGFEPEFIGRLPVRVVCQQLNAADLFLILKSSEGSIIRQYEQTFAAYGIEVLFRDDGLRRIAELAAEEQTGARGLMIGRGAIRNPWIFEQIRQRRRGETPFVPRGRDVLEYIRALYDAAKGPKSFTELRGGHNDAFAISRADYSEALRAFVETL